MKEKCGADYGINYRTHPDWKKKVLALTNGEGADILIENGGDDTIGRSLDALATDGQISVVGFSSQTDKLPDLIVRTMLKGVIIRGIRIGFRQHYEKALKFIHAKKLHFPIGETFGFTEDQIHLAYQKIASQTNVGKVAISLE